jgi:hypothetical protein
VVHRHLLPNEFDLLLDGDVGFGVVPLKAHVRECARCRSELEALQELTNALDELPRFAPSPGFADAVMSQVHVFRPWHVALRDTVTGLVPRSAPMRVLAGAGATGLMVFFGLVTAAVVFRLDLVLFSTNLLVDRVRTGALEVGGELVAALFGQPAMQAIAGAGGTTMAIVITLISLGSAALLALGVMAVAARRQRATR